MNDDDLQEQIQDMDSRIQAMKKSQKEDLPEVSAEDGELERINTRAGSELLASIIGGGVLGYCIDRFFDTMPWGMFFFLIMGFVSGVYRANTVMKEIDTKNSQKNTNPR